MPGKLPYRLLQCTLCGTTLENDIDAVGCSSSTANNSIFHNPHDTGSDGFELAAKTLLIEFKVLLMTYIDLNCLGPIYLKECFCLYKPAWSRRSAGETFPLCPTIENSSLCEDMGMIFSIVVPQLWKALPLEAWLAMTLALYQCHVKTYLLIRAFHGWGSWPAQF